MFNLTSEKDLIRSVDYFITHLRDDHEIPGEVYYTLLGIANWAREEKFVTHKQKAYVEHHLDYYSDQIDYFK